MLARGQELFFGIGVIATALVAGLVAVGFTNQSPSVPVVEPSRAPNGTSIETRGSSPEADQTDDDVAVLIAAGDIADCERAEDELTANLVETLPGTVVALGDNANPDGTLEQFEECYGPTWGRPSIKNRTRPAIGDNEYNVPGAAGYFTYFGDAAGDPAAGYYAFDAGSWRVYMLNSECSQIGGCGVGSPQEAWLLHDLAAEPRSCALAVMHRPYFTSGPSGGGSSAMRNLWRVLDEADAELVVSGHDHHYERFAPQTGAGRGDPDGMVQFVAGTGGARSDHIDIDAPNSEERATDVAGVLRFELGTNRYAFEFISVAGPDYRDSGSGECH